MQYVIWGKSVIYQKLENKSILRYSKYKSDMLIPKINYLSLEFMLDTLNAILGSLQKGGNRQG